MSLPSNGSSLNEQLTEQLPSQGPALLRPEEQNESVLELARELETPILIQVTFVFYVTFSVIIAVLNAFTVTAILTRPELKNVTNMFVLSLSSADLLLSPTLVLVNFLSGTPECFGDTGARVAATILLSIMYTSSGVSLFSILAIAVDRYYAVLHPYSYRQIMTARKATIIITSIWLYCSVFTSTLIGYFVAQTPPNIVVRLSLLSVIVPFWVYIGAIISQIVVCIIISIALYIRIFIAIKNRQQISLTSRGRNSNNEIAVRRRVTHTMAMVLGALVLSWAPYTILSVVVTQESISNHDWLVYVSMATILLLYSNSFMNPIIYASRCTNFRQAYWCMLCCACRALINLCPGKRSEDVAMTNNIKMSKVITTEDTNHVNATEL